MKSLTSAPKNSIVLIVYWERGYSNFHQAYRRMYKSIAPAQYKDGGWYRYRPPRYFSTEGQLDAVGWLSVVPPGVL